MIGREIEMHPIKRKLPLGSFRPEMAFPGEQEQKLAGGEMIVPAA